MKTLRFFYLAITLMLVIRCTHKNETRTDNYEIFNEEIIENSNKAQLIEYVVYKDTIYKQENLKKVLLEVYDKSKDKNVFKNFSTPNILVVYLYTSKNIAETDKSSWIAMLSFYKDNSEPKIIFNNLKVTSLQNLNNETIEADEIAYKELIDYLKKRNLELCSLNNQLENISIESIRKADDKFPNFGQEHYEYETKLKKDEVDKILKKHNLNDSILTSVFVFARAYCK